MPKSYLGVLNEGFEKRYGGVADKTSKQAPRRSLKKLAMNESMIGASVPPYETMEDEASRYFEDNFLGDRPFKEIRVGEILQFERNGQDEPEVGQAVRVGPLTGTCVELDDDTFTMRVEGSSLQESKLQESAEPDYIMGTDDFGNEIWASDVYPQEDWLECENKLEEAANPENEKVNSLIRKVLSGDSTAYKTLEKMGYTVEKDSSARKTLGRDKITITNNKTGKQLYANAGLRWKGDMVLARPTEMTKMKKSSDRHVLSGDAVGKQADPKAFDYKNFLDKEQGYREEEPVSSVKQFRDDKRFLRDNEFTARQIDSARLRMAAKRGKMAQRKHVEESLSRLITRVLRRLNEAEMSDEDRQDSTLLRAIQRKIYSDPESPLTPEEEAVLSKYNVGRGGRALFTQGGEFLMNRAIPDHGQNYEDDKKVNYADRARKRGTRMKRYDDGSIDSYAPFWEDPSTKHDPDTHGMLTDQQFARRHQNYKMSAPVRQMKNILDMRKSAQSSLDNVETSYQQELDKLNKRRDSQLRNYKGAVDKWDEEVKKRLRKESLEDGISETSDLTRAELASWFMKNHSSDPVLSDYDSFSEWLKDSVENGYIVKNDNGNYVWAEEKSESEEKGMSRAELASWFMKNRKSDPALEYYDSFSEWLKDSMENGYIVRNDDGDYVWSE